MGSLLIVGAGFSGAVIARELAERASLRSLVIDARDHVAGNCHSGRDPVTGILVHTYGPHIFHTSRADVWGYACRFARFSGFVNRVKASIPQGVFSLPINLHTVNQFFGKRFSPAEARAFVGSLGDSGIGEPKNFEEQALKLLGRELYEAFFYGYTKKQWGCEPSELPASILNRLPIRFSYDDNYYNDIHQGIPLDGYTPMIERILDHPLIEVSLSTPWEPSMAADHDHVVYTGPLDAFYGHRHGRLGYRTVSWVTDEVSGDHQGNAIINYPHPSAPFTRVIEHKHFAPHERHERSIVSAEYSRDTGPDDVPYYPKRLAADTVMLDRYLALARQEKAVSFLGRLATYRYLDMHQVIGESLDFAPLLADALSKGALRPVFPPALGGRAHRPTRN